MLRSIEGSNIKEAEANHGHGRGDGQRGDELQEAAQEPRVANDQLDDGGHADGALHLPHPFLPQLLPLLLVQVLPEGLVTKVWAGAGPLALQGQDGQGGSYEGECPALDDGKTTSDN